MRDFHMRFSNYADGHAMYSTCNWNPKKSYLELFFRNSASDVAQPKSMSIFLVSILSRFRQWMKISPMNPFSFFSLCVSQIVLSNGREKHIYIKFTIDRVFFVVCVLYYYPVGIPPTHVENKTNQNENRNRKQSVCNFRK